MTPIDRVRQMELLFDNVAPVIKEMQKITDKYVGLQEDLATLIDYYDSGKWTEDFENDEAGLFPKDMKRGILSEDALWNLLADNSNLLCLLQKICHKSNR